MNKYCLISSIALLALINACNPQHTLNCDGKEGILRKMDLRNEQGIISFIQNEKVDTSARCSKHDPLIVVAVSRGHLKLTKLLLDRGEDINTVDKNKHNLLNIAAGRGRQELVRMILDKGVDVNKVSSDHTAIFWAARGGHSAVVNILLAKGADVSIRSGHSDTPLIQSVVGGKIGILKRILERDEAINAQNAFGTTALIETGRGNHKNEAKMANILLARGADPNIQDNEGLTVLSMAAKKGNKQVVKALLSGNARVDVDIEDENGKTALMYAQENNNKDIIEMIQNNIPIAEVVESPEMIQNNIPIAEVVESRRSEL